MSTYHEDETYFTISEVAKQIGVVPATIRGWERAGLFSSKRALNGYRIYNFDDIYLLEQIRKRSKRQGLDMQGIRQLYRNGGVAFSPDGGEVVVSRKLLSEKWKEFRQQRGFLLEDVAKAVGISASYLSKIENLQANVSLNVLQRLADFYGENLLYYVKESEEGSPLVKRKQGEMMNVGIPGVSVESVVFSSGSTLSALIYPVEAAKAPPPTAARSASTCCRARLASTSTTSRSCSPRATRSASARTCYTAGTTRAAPLRACCGFIHL